MFRILLTIVLILLLTIKGMANTVLGCRSVLFGKVIDKDLLEPLSFTGVYLVELQKGVQSDAEGNFILSDLCKATYTLKLSHTGCETKEVKIHINLDSQRVVFELPHTAHEKGEVVITAHHNKKHKGANSFELSGLELFQTQGSTFGEALGKQSGMNELKTGNGVSKPIIRGMHSQRIGILFNGVKLESQQWGSEHAPEIDPLFFNSVSVIKGAGGLQYGTGANSGYILAEPKDMLMPVGLRSELYINGMSNGIGGGIGAMIEGANKKFPNLSFRVQVAGKKKGNVHTAHQYLDNTGVEEFNTAFNSRYQYKKWIIEGYYSRFQTEIGIFSGAHIGNLTDLDRILKSGITQTKNQFSYLISRPKQEVSHEVLQGKIIHKINDNSSLLAKWNTQYNIRSEFDKHAPRNDSLAKLNLPELSYKLFTQQGELLYQYHNEHGREVKVGSQASVQGNVVKGRVFIPNYEQQTVSAFIVWQEEIKNLIIDGGLRFDYTQLSAYYQLVDKIESPSHYFRTPSAHLTFKYHLTDDIHISSQNGFGYRPPIINELYSQGLHHGVGAIERGNRHLLPEQSLNNSLVLEYDNHSKWDVSLEPYLQNIANFIYLYPDKTPQLTIRGAFPSFSYRQTDIQLTGIESNIKYNLSKHIQLGGQINILRAWDKTQEEWLIQMPSDRFGLSISYHDELEEFKIKSFGGKVNPIFVQKQFRVPEGVDYALPPPSYFLINCEGYIDLEIHKQPIKIGISIQNGLNNSYKDYMNRLRYFQEEQGLNVLVRINIPINLITT